VWILTIFPETWPASEFQVTWSPILNSRFMIPPASRVVCTPHDARAIEIRSPVRIGKEHDAMNPIFRGIEKVEAKVGHSLHPALVGIPIGAWVTSACSDLLAMSTADSAYDHAARVSMAVGLVGAGGSAITGLHDYSYIPKDRSPNHQIATTHALGNLIATSLFAASYVSRTRAMHRGRRPSALARSLGLIGTSLIAYAGWLGGKLVEELGEAVKPVMEQQSREQERLRKTS
jgi:uncharacterized membrane protein